MITANDFNVIEFENYARPFVLKKVFDENLARTRCIIEEDDRVIDAHFPVMNWISLHKVCFHLLCFRASSESRRLLNRNSGLSSIIEIRIFVVEENFFFAVVSVDKAYDVVVNCVLHRYKIFR